MRLRPCIRHGAQSRQRPRICHDLLQVPHRPHHPQSRQRPRLRPVPKSLAAQPTQERNVSTRHVNRFFYFRPSRIMHGIRLKFIRVIADPR